MQHTRPRSGTLTTVVAIIEIALGLSIFTLPGAPGAAGLATRLPYLAPSLIACGLLLLALQARARPATEATVAAASLPDLEQTLFFWTWLLGLLVVALAAMGGEEAVALPAAARGFVLAVSAFNLTLHWLLAGVGTPARRIFWHLAFISVAVGILLSAAGPTGHYLLAVLALTPALATYALGTGAGYRILALAAAVVILGELGPWHGANESLGVSLTEGVAEVVVVIVAALGAIRHAANQRRLVQELVDTRAGLQESEQRFRGAFGNAAIGMGLCTAAGSLVQVNTSLCEMLGYSAGELLTMGLDDTVLPEDRELAQAQRKQLLAGAIDRYQVETRLRHKLGHVVWAQLNVAVVRGEQGEPLYLIAQVQDLTERRRFEAQLTHLASRDPVTDLFNRRRFHEELQRVLAHSQRYFTHGALLVLDLDRLKYINDSLGPLAGDQFLQGMGNLLRRRLRQTDAAARLGGDEFAVLLPGDDAAAARQAAEELLAAIRRLPVPAGNQTVSTTASIGIALFPDHGMTADELLARASMALHAAKASGRDTLVLYSDALDQHEQIESKLRWERRIREALTAGHFFLVAQPVVGLRSRQVVYYEMLLRMRGEDGEVILPGAFLDVAERCGLIHAIDRWVVTEAIRLIAGRRRAGQDLCLGVNLSGQAFSDPGLLPLIQQELAASGIDPHSLVLEITETTAVADLGQARHFAETLRALGCRFALDDFGSGFSSFYLLKHLPVDFMKIDGSYVSNLASNATDQHLVRAMVEVARGLGKQVIAEYVGDPSTLRMLRSFGVDYAQGYHIGMPGPLPEAPAAPVASGRKLKVGDPDLRHTVSSKFMNELED